MMEEAQGSGTPAVIRNDSAYQLRSRKGVASSLRPFGESEWNYETFKREKGYPLWKTTLVRIKQEHLPSRQRKVFSKPQNRFDCAKNSKFPTE